MSKVEKHPTDKGKFQSTFDNYGHGKGNGKSRNAIYKHAKKLENPKPDFVKPVEEPQPEITQNQEKIEVEETNNSTDWSNVSWADDDFGDVKPKSIPEPIQQMAQGRISEVTMQAQGQMIRFGFTALDRMITHWGRGVMNKPEYTLERHPSDLDALEASTMQLMAHYGIQVPVSPLMVWGATVGSAYAPPIMHIRKNADPNRKKRGLGFLSRLNPFKRKKKKQEQAPNQEVVPNESNS
tara:strand:- start:1765 stop:2478 length:714 start_codon:yes stop_codon:yes gene_type:complete